MELKVSFANLVRLHFKLYIKTGLDFSSVAKCVPRTCELQPSIPSIASKIKDKQEKLKSVDADTQDHLASQSR